ncbi:GNAT family N-acetyltransferase [Roseobacter weihaiensis]|uniref:GNAT family N-acetyltransferase n=1 Tax=Roseobacter weihaiensis TaxID=2763262 RepID=UPI001D0A5CD9|nr:GNAT family N-acetyltransferase [Roseobacter sp. H9]
MYDAIPDAPAPSLQQSPEFARTLKAVGQEPGRLPCGALTLRRAWAGLRVTMLPRAIMPVPKQTCADLKQTGYRGPVIFSPDHPAALESVGALPLVGPAVVAELDLTLEEDRLEARLHQKWRNRLRHARGQDLRVTRQNMPDDPAHWLLHADLQRQQSRGYRSWPVALTRAYAARNPGAAKLFTAFQGGHAVAAILILRHGPGATYHIGHATPLGRETSAQTLLLWEAMRWLKRKGGSVLDLGLIDTEDAPGIARFKLGTGARARRLGGTWIWWPPMTRMLRPLASMDRKLMQSGSTGVG